MPRKNITHRRISHRRNTSRRRDTSKRRYSFGKGNMRGGAEDLHDVPPEDDNNNNNTRSNLYKLYTTKYHSMMPQTSHPQLSPETQTLITLIRQWYNGNHSNTEKEQVMQALLG